VREALAHSDDQDRCEHIRGGRESIKTLTGSETSKTSSLAQRAPQAILPALPLAQNLRGPTETRDPCSGKTRQEGGIVIVCPTHTLCTSASCCIQPLARHIGAWCRLVCGGV